MHFSFFSQTEGNLEGRDCQRPNTADMQSINWTTLLAVHFFCALCSARICQTNNKIICALFKPTVYCHQSHKDVAKFKATLFSV